MLGLSALSAEPFASYRVSGTPQVQHEFETACHNKLVGLYAFCSPPTFKVYEMGRTCK